MTSSSTVFVTLCDQGYFDRAKKTIAELRSHGKWAGDMVLIAVDFLPDMEFVESQNVQVFATNHINTDNLVNQLHRYPLGWSNDNRHLGKLHQWDKLQIFRPHFKQWDRVVFLDAGMRVFDTVEPLFALEWKGKIVAPDDSDPYDNGNRFGCQLRLAANPPATERLFQEFPQSICEQKYFLNCIFIFDTALIGPTTFSELEEGMNKFPLCGTNEMTLMNLFFTFKWNVWTPMEQKTAEGKYIFGWSELNYREKPTYRNFHFIKYPVTV